MWVGYCQSSVYSGQILLVHSKKCALLKVGTCPVAFSGAQVPQTEKTSQHTLVMLGLQRDRVPDGKAWGMTSDESSDVIYPKLSSVEVCLAIMSVHTQRQMVPKFRQYNIPLHCAVQTKQLELRCWQLHYVTGMWGFMSA